MGIKHANAMVYVQEEISDARLRCDELKRMMVKALEMINASDKADHFYAVAGDMIYAAPQVLTKLEKALGAAAMAVNEIDNGSLKVILRPEKVDELEKVLEEVRMRIPRRT